MKNWDIAKRIRLILVLMMLAAIAVRSIPVGFPWILLPGSLYAVIAVIWTAGLGYRIGPDHTRRLMTAVGILCWQSFLSCRITATAWPSEILSPTGCPGS
ncbi:MAG: hypothetical protein II166_00660, partial [Firmicutes bacterium]|nr:hypothetical protein [Bacillota bacterium]